MKQTQLTKLEAFIYQPTPVLENHNIISSNNTDGLFTETAFILYSHSHQSNENKYEKNYKKGVQIC